MSHPEPQPAPPASQERSRSPAPVRGGGLTVWLAFMLLSSAYLCYAFLSTYIDLEQHADPTRPHWPFLVFSLLCVNQVAGVVALFLWRKWGLYLIALGGLGSLAVDFLSGLPLVVEDLLPLLGLLILVGLLRSNGRWQLFHF